MESDLSVEELVEMFRLRPLEGEGGFFRRTWFRPADQGSKPEASCILYLITPESFSALHRLAHDEMFHFYLGDPCRSITMNESGVIEETILGQDVRAGMRVQHLVPGGTWQATKLLAGGRFALLGTTMSPGFHESDFELGTSALLAGLKPGAQQFIREVLASQHAS
jgi:predicted cupin superfamily sugar epimerase